MGEAMELNGRVAVEGARPVPVSLRIYDLAGCEVRTLEDAELPPGPLSRIWDGQRVTAGVYLYRLVVDRVVTTRKLTVLR